MPDARPDGQRDERRSARSVSRMVLRDASSSVGHTAACDRLVGDDLHVEAVRSLVGPDRDDRHVQLPGAHLIDQRIGTVCAERDFDIRMFGVEIGEQRRDVDAVRCHRADRDGPAHQLA